MKKKYITPCVTLMLLPSTHLLITSLDGDTDLILGGASPEEPEEPR